MTWKHTLGKPGYTYIISKHWVKKNIPKSKRLPKNLFKDLCSDYIYYIGFHYTLDDPINPQELWICMNTGKLFKKTEILSFYKNSNSNLDENSENLAIKRKEGP